MEAIHSPETSVNARSTQRYIPEDDVRHCHRSENHKTYNFGFGNDFDSLEVELRESGVEGD
jgi:hypothetical protein